MVFSEESDEDYIPTFEDESDAEHDDVRSPGAPEPEHYQGEETDDDDSNGDDDSGDEDFDDSFKNLALKTAFKWKLPLEGTVVGFLSVGPSYYQVLLR